MPSPNSVRATYAQPLALKPPDRADSSSAGEINHVRTCSTTTQKRSPDILTIRRVFVVARVHFTTFRAQSRFKASWVGWRHGSRVRLELRRSSSNPTSNPQISRTSHKLTHEAGFVQGLLHYLARATRSIDNVKCSS